MTDSHRVRRMTYTSKSQSIRGTEMNTMHLLVAERMNDRLREAKNERLARLASRHTDRPGREERSTRERPTIAERISATGAALRAPADDCLDGQVAKRPA
jgi:hypothetical protein